MKEEEKNMRTNLRWLRKKLIAYYIGKVPHREGVHAMGRRGDIFLSFSEEAMKLPLDAFKALYESGRGIYFV